MSDESQYLKRKPKANLCSCCSPSSAEIKPRSQKMGHRGKRKRCCSDNNVKVSKKQFTKRGVSSLRNEPKPVEEFETHVQTTSVKETILVSNNYIGGERSTRKSFISACFKISRSHVWQVQKNTSSHSRKTKGSQTRASKRLKIKKKSSLLKKIKTITLKLRKRKQRLEVKPEIKPVKRPRKQNRWQLSNAKHNNCVDTGKKNIEKHGKMVKLEKNNSTSNEEVDVDLKEESMLYSSIIKHYSCLNERFFKVGGKFSFKMVKSMWCSRMKPSSVLEEEFKRPSFSMNDLKPFVEKIGGSNPCSVLLKDIIQCKVCYIKLDKYVAPVSVLQETSEIVEEETSYSNSMEHLGLKRCSIVLKDCYNSVHLAPTVETPRLEKNLLHLSVQATEEIINNDFLTSDHINKFHDILACETEFQPRDVLLIWLTEDIQPVKNRLHIQILPAAPTEDVTHWVCTFYDGRIVRVYDSAKDGLTDHQEQFLYRLFPDKPKIVYENVQKQPNNYDCGVFAIAFATALAKGCDPSKELFDVSLMRPHLLEIFSTNRLKPFPRLPLPVSNAKPFSHCLKIPSRYSARLRVS